MNVHELHPTKEGTVGDAATAAVTEQATPSDEVAVDVPAHEAEAESSRSVEDQLEELPEALRPAADALASALEVDVPGKFPEDDPYPAARQAEAIAQELIAHQHGHLTDAAIWYVFRQSLNRNKTPIPGRARKTGPRVKAMSEWDFTVDVNWTLWAQASALERVRIMDELLTFCARDPDSGSFEYKTPEVITHVDPLARWGPRAGSHLERAVKQLDLGL